MGPVKQVDIVLNPVAGCGRALRLYPKLKSYLKGKTGMDVFVHLTRKRGDAVKITRHLVKSGAELIVAAGGDGTINEVVNGFFDGNGIINANCELGILRLGTGQGTALSLKIPSGLKEQLELIAGPDTTFIDIGKLSYYNFENCYCERYFISESQIGIGSIIAAQVHNGYKFLGGKLAFGAVAVKQIFSYQPETLRITVDHDFMIQDELLGIAIGNGGKTAGGMRLTPDARPDDGLLNILIIHQMAKIKRLAHFSRIYSGRHIHCRGFTYSKGRKISVSSVKPTTVSADGELLGYTPCAITVIPHAIKVKSFIN